MLNLVLRQGFIPVLIGVGIGLACALAGGRLIASHLYGITQTDLLTFSGTVLLVAFTAMIAMAYPASRASRVVPLVALRHEGSEVKSSRPGGGSHRLNAGAR